MSTHDLGVPDQGIVLGIPRWCGLNDTFVQIWSAYQYALQSGRRLMIDTRISGFWDHFDEYFELYSSTDGESVPIQMRVTSAELASLNSMKVYPRSYQGCIEFIHREIRLRSLVAHNHQRLRRSIAFVTRALKLRAPSLFKDGFARRVRFLTFVMLARVRKPSYSHGASRDHDLIVHHASGGGNESLSALSLFSLTQPVRQAVLEALDTCGDDFDAIHVRNTDSQSDYERLLTESRRRLRGRRVLVCSDDAAVLAAAKERLSDSVVFAVTTTEATGGLPLHKIGCARTPHERRVLNFNMIIDLICLSRSCELLTAETKGAQRSGFSVLARMLHDRSDIVQQLLRM